MLAHQLICISRTDLNTNKKSIRVYAKSESVTQVEINEIISTLFYYPLTKPAEALDEENIERVLPKNTAFFRLQFGRCCLARACYIDCEGEDGYSFFLHALVFDDPQQLKPMLYYGSDIFLEHLPDIEEGENLPQLEVTVPRNIPSDGKLRIFFDSSRQRILARLLQSLLKSVDDGRPVYFSDEEENIPLWLAALSYCLPGDYSLNIYFSTFSHVKKIGLNLCRIPYYIKGFSYEQEAAGSKCICFDIQHEIYSVNAVAGCYSDKAVRSLLTSKSTATAFVKEIEQIQKEYPTLDCDGAFDMLKLMSGDIEWFEKANSLYNVLSLYFTSPNPDYNRISRCVYAELGVNESLRCADEAILIFKKIFPYIDKISQNDVLMMYLDYWVKRSDTEDILLFEKGFRQACPAAWEKSLMLFTRNSSITQLIEKQTAAAYYLSFVLLTEDYNRVVDESERVLRNGFLCDIFAKTLNSMNIVAVSATVNCALKNNKCANMVFGSFLNGDLTVFKENSKYAFEIARMTIDDQKIFWNVVIAAYECNSDKKESVFTEYLLLREESFEKLKVAESYAKIVPSVLEFLTYLKIYIFDKTEKMTKTVIFEAFDNFVNVDYTNPTLEKNVHKAFNAGLDAYLESLSDKNRIKDGYSIYQKLFYNRKPLKYDKGTVEVLNNRIFVGSSIDSLAKTLNDLSFVEDIMNNLEEFDLRILPELQLLHEGLMFTACAKGSKKAKENLSQRLAENTFFYIEMPMSENMANEFISIFGGAILDCITVFTNSGNSSGALIELFLRPMAAHGDFRTAMVKGLKNITEPTEVLTLIFDYIFATESAFSNTLIEKVCEAYLASIGKSKRTAIFEQLIQKVENKDEMALFIRRFNKNHRGFIERVKSFFGKESEEEE